MPSYASIVVAVVFEEICLNGRSCNAIRRSKAVDAGDDIRKHFGCHFKVVAVNHDQVRHRIAMTEKCVMRVHTAREKCSDAIPYPRRPMK